MVPCIDSTTLVAEMTPVIRARIARAITRRGLAERRDPGQEVDDLTQDVLLLLFRDDASVLRAWRPDGGLSFLNYVGLVAGREAGHITRSGKRSPWALKPTEDAELEAAVGALRDDPESAAASREDCERVFARMREGLDEDARRLFELLFIEELPVREVAARTGLGAPAIYGWRRRLLARVRELRARPLAD